jgi:mono/diheme cytochrome c family protein
MTSGLTNVPIGITQYLDGGTNGGTQSAWNWQVVSTPVGSDVTALTNPTSETPSFTPDLPGQYVLLENVSGQELTVNAGTYVGWQQCAQCHNGNVAMPVTYVTVGPWLGTKHATMFTKMINGDYQDDDNYTLHCVGCHTLGDTPEQTAHSNGWWDAYVTSGWVFPFVANNYSYAINYNNWNNMPQSLKNMSNIQCENCHGPGSVHTGALSYNQAVCFQCHDDTDDEDTANEWRTSVHAQSLTAAGGLVTKNLGCVKCHVSQEIVAVNFEGLPPTIVTNPYPINCVACHDPHSAANPNDLRLYGSEAVAGGSFTLTNIGTGAICTMCHSDQISNPNTAIQYALSLTGTSSAAAAATSATDVHEPTAEIFAAGQGFTLVGAGAYAATVQSSPHAIWALYSGNGQNLCVTCHMYNPSYFTITTGNHSFAMSDGLVDDTEACAQCHTVGVPTGTGYGNIVTGFDTWVEPFLATSVPNWDGSTEPAGQEGIQDRVQGLLSVLACAITTTSTLSTPGTCTANTVDINGIPVVWTVSIPTARGTANVMPPSNGTAGFTFTNTFTQQELDAVYNYNLVANEGSMGIHNTKFDVELLQKAIADITNAPLAATLPGATPY